MDELEKFWRDADEAADLFERGRVAYPIGELPGVKAHDADLERRWKNGDKRIVAYFEGDDGKPTRFGQMIFPEEEARLIDGYLSEQTTWIGSEKEKRLEASVFVGTIARHAFLLPFSEAAIPPDQKERKRTIKSAANAFDKLADSLDKLDSAALGWVFAAMEDSAAKVGMSLRPHGPDVVSLAAHPLRATVEAGEVRRMLTVFAREVGPAIRKAAATLPKAERDDPRTGATFFLERLMLEHSLPFNPVETSYAAECLRTMFELAGYDTDRISYWLTKIADTPNSERPWHAALRKT